MNCRYCGAQNEENAIYCGQCGLQLIDDETVIHNPYDTLDTSAQTIPSTVLGNRAPKRKGGAIRLRESYEDEEQRSKLEEALRNDPYNVSILFELKSYGEALRASERALRLNPNDADAHSCRARIFYEFGAYKEALFEIDEALRLYPVESSFTVSYDHLMRGLILEMLGRYEEALSAYNESLRIDPKSPASSCRDDLLRRSNPQN